MSCNKFEQDNTHTRLHIFTYIFHVHNADVLFISVHVYVVLFVNMFAVAGVSVYAV